MKQRYRPPANRRGFSLIELLVVLAFIAAAAAIFTPSVADSRKGLEITNTTDIISDSIRRARQYARAENRVFEVRFLKYGSPGNFTKEQNFRAIGTYRILPNGTAQQVDKIEAFPGLAIVGNSEEHSSLLVSGRQGEVAIRNVTGYIVTAPYVAVGFLPSGGTTLPAGRNHYITVWDETHALALDESELPPPNFATIQIDALTGGTQVFRPEL